MTSIRHIVHHVDDNVLPPSNRQSIRTTQLGPKITSRATHFNIELILDTICPRCYIGLKNIDSAIARFQLRHPEVTFEMTCTPFPIDPRSYQPAYERVAGFRFSWDGRSGTSRDSHKLLRFALEASPSIQRSVMFMRHNPPPISRLSLPIERLKQTRTPAPGLAPTAAPPGDNFLHATSTSSPASLETPISSAIPATVTPGTLHYSQSDFPPSLLPPPVTSPQLRGPALQMALARAIFQLAFERDADISNHDILTQVGAQVTGFAATDIRECLESDEWGGVVDALCGDAIGRNPPEGITAIPTMIIQYQYQYGGWAEVDKLVEIFESIHQGRQPFRPSATSGFPNISSNTGIGMIGPNSASRGTGPSRSESA